MKVKKTQQWLFILITETSKDSTKYHGDSWDISAVSLAIESLYKMW